MKRIQGDASKEDAVTWIPTLTIYLLLAFLTSALLKLLQYWEFDNDYLSLIL